MKKDVEEKLLQAAGILPDWLQKALSQLGGRERAGVQEIRLRTNRPVQVVTGGGSVFYGERGWSALPQRGARVVEKSEVTDVFRLACGYSVHTHRDEISQGYVTVPGGHRVGVCGTAVWEDGRLKTLRSVSSINVRVAGEAPGSADGIMGRLRTGLCGVLLAGPPCSGKTTVLRDLARQLSNTALRVSIVDERGELAACVDGVPQNDVGFCTDVLDGMTKGAGVMRAVRALSPDVVVCDEIGSPEDVRALTEAAGSGVTIVATAHAGGERELLQKPYLRELTALGVFRIAVFLERGDQVGSIRSVLDLEEAYAKDSGTYAAGGLLRGSWNSGGG